MSADRSNRIFEAAYKIATLSLALFSVVVLIWNFNLANRLSRLEGEALSFDTKIVGNSLIFTSRGERFSVPSDLRVEPIFSQPTVQGGVIPVPSEAGIIRISSRSIVFENLLQSLCLYEENAEACSNYEIEQLIVQYNVNGVPDTDVVVVPRA